MTIAISNLRLVNFRCYDDISLHLGSTAIVITGENGAGKTNILEAISFLSPTKGLRHAKLEDVTNNKNKTQIWAVSAKLNTPYGNTQIGTGLDVKNNRRIVKIDGELQKGQSILSEYCSIVWVTPQMDRLFLDGSAIRRRFLDQVIFNFEPSHLGRLNRYNKAMRERSRLLKEWGADKADTTWLSSLETIIAETAMAIAAARLTMVERLQKACEDNHLDSDIFPLPKVTVNGWVEKELEHSPAIIVEEKFKELLKNSRPKDAIIGGSEYGTHKSDFIVFHKGHSIIADQCSTGEQKGLLMALTLAHARLIKAEKGQAPILLLDEMAAHLDENRRETLFDMCLQLGGQCWMSGTDKNIFNSLKNKADFLYIDNANLHDNNTNITESRLNVVNR